MKEIKIKEVTENRKWEIKNRVGLSPSRFFLVFIPHRLMKHIEEEIKEGVLTVAKK